MNVAVHMGRSCRAVLECSSGDEAKNLYGSQAGLVTVFGLAPRKETRDYFGACYALGYADSLLLVCFPGEFVCVQFLLQEVLIFVIGLVGFTKYWMI